MRVGSGIAPVRALDAFCAASITFNVSHPPTTMSNFDDPRALERALVTIVQEIIGNAITPQAVVNTAARAAAATTDVVKGLDLREPWTVLKWLKEARKQIGGLHIP